MLAPRPSGSNLRFVTLSPEMEMLDEDLGDTTIIRSWRKLHQGRLAGVHTDYFYMFKDALGRFLESDEIEAQIEEANALLDDGGGGGGAGGEEPPEVGGGLLAKALASVLGGGGGSGGSGPPAAPGSAALSSHEPVAGGGLIAAALAAAGCPPTGADGWVVASNAPGFLAGERAPLGGRRLLGEEKGVIILDGKQELFVCTRACFEQSGLSVVNRAGLTQLAIVSEESRPESRIWKVSRDTAGQRYFDFRQATDNMTGDLAKVEDSPVSGPATVKWLMKFMAKNGGSPTSYHTRWMSESRLDYSAGGTAEHQSLCNAFETLICVDQVDPSKLAACELMARKIQIIHEKWKAKLPSLASGPKDGGDDDSHLLLGTYETRGNLAVCPALTRWLGEELSREALANKERRKAREERALAASKK